MTNLTYNLIYGTRGQIRRYRENKTCLIIYFPLLKNSGNPMNLCTIIQYMILENDLENQNHWKKYECKIISKSSLKTLLKKNKTKKHA